VWILAAVVTSRSLVLGMATHFAVEASPHYVASQSVLLRVHGLGFHGTMIWRTFRTECDTLQT
jgi:hypothetical protein